MKGDTSWVPGPVDHDWIEDVASPVHPVLAELEAAAVARERIPILDRAAGRVLAILAADRRAIAEVGTAIGYSTLAMALAQSADGTIVTIDPDARRTARARAAWRAAGISDARISVVDEPALAALAAGRPALAGPFDMLFIDALKHEYLAYLEAFLPRLAPGALVVADNVLWSGGVSARAAAVAAGDAGPADPDTEALRRFCESVCADPRFAATILPVGDGLLLARYRG
jgi:caffeoyl-CoA O-methyltransferase